MPNCFCLYRKDSDPKSEPLPLNLVDEEICKALGVAVHPKRWVEGWYDSIGWMIAVFGMDFPAIRRALTLPCESDGPSKTNPDEFDHCKVHDGGIRRGTPYRECSRSWPDRPELLPILDFMEANYRTSAWVEIGRR